jgi:imidazolonepropionase
MKSLIVNASELLTMTGPARPRRGKEMSRLGLIRDGAVLVDEGLIVAAGLRQVVLKHPQAKGARVIDAGGRVVLPGFVDSHSHPVFVEPRLKDFESRIQGKSYADIAAQGGGILSTVAGVRGASLESLAERLERRCADFLACGTTTLEAKSGYGLDPDNELKMLRAIRLAAEKSPLELVPTFLGAHAVPGELRGRSEDYVRRVCGEMIPIVAKEGLARFIDIFCEEGYFTAEQAERVLAAGAKAGLRAKIHAEQLSHYGGAAVGLKAGACSADHLDCVKDEDLAALAGSETVACLVPGSNYFLNKPYPPGRRLIDSGAAVALATDFNPGTCPCWDMRMIISIACTQMKMTPAEALTAATVNGAWALGLGQTLGSIEPGLQADLVCHDVEDHREIAYYFGVPSARWVMKKGNLVHGKEAGA